MSGYRRLKRALGETNIERKCRVLFGVCLALLIFAASLGVENICRRLVEKVIHQAGKDAVDWTLTYIHFNFWQQGPDEADQEKRQKYQNLLESFSHELKRERFDFKVLHLPGEESTWLELNKLSVPAASNLEVAVLERLREQWKQKYTDQIPITAPENVQTKESPTGALVPETPEAEGTKLDVPSETIPAPPNYYYYQPLVWTKSCLTCHFSTLAGALPASDVAASSAETPPFRVVRVIMSDKETRDALTWVRATLIGTGILTLFVAMLGLYVIVKYVIVKPLTHLRDVSDAISQGNLQQRADIHTNDEFEELGDAFNRMLRHLTEAQNELQSVNANLDAKVDELAQANMQLYDMNRLKSDFLANMSHELRTPLNSIIGFSDVLHGIDSLSDKQRRYAQNIQKSGRVLLDMINDILDLAKLEAGKMELRPTEFRLDTVITAQCDMMRSLSEDKNIDLEVIVDPQAPPIYQDQSKVQQVLTNLLSNAIKFTPEGGRITVRAVQMDDDQLELTVSDTGVGIPEEDSDIIFEKFRQSKTVLGRDRLTREYSGTGLGLSIVKELCKLLGGEISFTSELGKGSTFKVVLPWSLPNRTRLNLAFASKMSESLAGDRRSDLSDADLAGASHPANE
jgi:two-component system, NarL family, sensor histidine kinase BarA